MKKQKLVIALSPFVCLILFASISAQISNPHDRSVIGRIFRWMKGESTIDQRANDLAEDIRTKPEFKELQTWAMNVLNRFQKGQVQTNNTAYFWRVDKSVALASSETPKFINDTWAFTNKSSGWVLPEISVVFSNDDIGHPKLFMAGEEAERNRSPQPAVKNFAAAQNIAARFGWF